MNKTIFLVDDTDSILTLAASVLENDYMVLTMMSADKMFSIIEKKKPDLIILDVEMPDMNGFEALSKLREDPLKNDIPVMFLTGYIDDDILAKCDALGASGVMDKNDIKSSLFSKVTELLA